MKMSDNFETIGKVLLPLFRSLVAKELIVTHKLTQNQASEILGTTQAAISHYVNSKRAVKGSNEFADKLPKIQEIACQTARQLVMKQVTWKEASANYCKICSDMFAEEDTNKTGDNYNI